MLTLTFIALATWRITCDFVQEDGPFGVYHRVRTSLKAWAEARIDASDVADPVDHHWFWVYDGIDCFVCVSFWVAGVLTLLAWLALGAQAITFGVITIPDHAIFSQIVSIFLHWLAAAAAARFLDALYTRIVNTPTSPPFNHGKSQH